MTSLQLDILNHYYASASDYKFEGNITRLQQANVLISWGLLSKDEELKINTGYIITDKGKFFIEYILNLPLPEQTYTIGKGE